MTNGQNRDYDSFTLLLFLEGKKDFVNNCYEKSTLTTSQEVFSFIINYSELLYDKTGMDK